jgi:DNA repair protein RadC
MATSKIVRLSLFCGEKKKPTSHRIRCAGDLYTLGRPLEDFDKEVMVVATLTQKNFVISTHLVSLGTLTASLVHPREVLRPVLEDCAAAFALIHNHPSGHPDPSREDTTLTKRLAACGALLGVRLLDHVIIGANVFYSYQEMNSDCIDQAKTDFDKALLAADGMWCSDV